MPTVLQTPLYVACVVMGWRGAQSEGAAALCQVLMRTGWEGTTQAESCW